MTVPWSAAGGPRRRLATAAATAVLGLALVGCAAAAGSVGPVSAPVIEPSGVVAASATASTTTHFAHCVEGEVDSIRPPEVMPTPGQMRAGTFMAAIQAKGYLTAGVDQNNYRWGYRDPRSGELDGFDVDMVRQVAKAIFGTDRGHLHLVVVPNSDRVGAVQNGKVDIVAETMTVNCKRRTQVSFSAVYFVARQRVLVPEGSPITSDGELAGRRVCAAATSTSLTNLEAIRAIPPIEPVSAANQTDCLVLLQQGQVDAISTDDTILNGMARQDPALHLVGEPLSVEPYGMAINLAHPEFTAFVNGVLAQERLHTWGHLYVKWLGGTQAPKMPAPTYESRASR